MFKFVLGKVLPVLVLGLSGAQAMAGDAPLETLPPPPPELRGSQADPMTGGFGNVHIGPIISLASFGDGTASTALNVGGKFAHDGGPEAWGYQIDGDADYTTSGMYGLNAGPSVTGMGIFDFAVHVTYMPANESKIGAFVGSFGETAFGTVGGTSAIASVAFLGAGIEGLYVFQNGIMAQSRAAIIGPSYATVTAFSGGGAASVAGLKTDNPLGMAASVGVSKRFTNNISGRLDGNIVNLPAINYSMIQAAATAQYNLDETPLAFGATVGYDIANNGAPANGLFAKARMTYSFGGTSSGATGKLFRSGLTGLLN